MAAYNEIFDGIAEFPPFSDGAVLVARKQIPDTHKLSKYLERNPLWLDIYHTSNFWYIAFVFYLNSLRIDNIYLLKYISK